MRLRLRVEGTLDGWRQFALRFHGLQHLLSKMLDVFRPGCCAFPAGNLIDDPALAGVTPLVEELAQRFLLLEELFEFRWNDNRTVGTVRLQREFRFVAGVRLSA